MQDASERLVPPLPGGHPASPDARAVLGLPPDATRDEAQRAFRRLAKQTHPDAGGDPGCFRAVASAWAELAPALPQHRRRPAPSPHAAAYRAPLSRVVWAEARPAVRPVRPDFASFLEAEMARLAA